MINKNYMSMLKAAKKVFVYCPAGVITGGAELLHQLVDVLNGYEKDAYIVYFGNKPPEIPEPYRKYKVKVASDIEDLNYNIVVLYEGYFKKAFSISDAKVLLWWLSVDNCFIAQRNELYLYDLFSYKKRFALKELVKRCGGRVEKCTRFSLKTLEKRENVVGNAAQSYYAYQYLINKKYRNVVMLSDYINTDFIDKKDIYPKNDIVLYYPNKGTRFVKKIIEKDKMISWKPIEKMSRHDVIIALKKCKLYIDFGYHPGKDRVPREAAICGCCIITGKKGAAKYYQDIPIDENKYKYRDVKSEIPNIIKNIHWILDNYEEAIVDFSYYQQQIAKEKETFISEVKYIFIED